MAYDTMALHIKVTKSQGHATSSFPFNSAYSLLGTQALFVFFVVWAAPFVSAALGWL